MLLLNMTAAGFIMHVKVATEFAALATSAFPLQAHWPPHYSQMGADLDTDMGTGMGMGMGMGMSMSMSMSENHMRLRREPQAALVRMVHRQEDG